nr:multicopper oxidase domain-containing protein [Alkalilimnicola ehrlichii]
MIVPVGSTRTIEFVADNPGDWALHCHMTHHIMNQMGHGIPNMIGVDPGDFDERMQSMLPGYMTMGETGMGDHGEHVEAGHMRVPENSIPMVGMPGPRGYITMGGMVTVLKVRDELENYDEDPGWYENPEGTEARLAREEELRRDGIDVSPREEVPDERRPVHEGHH